MHHPKDPLTDPQLDQPVAAAEGLHLEDVDVEAHVEEPALPLPLLLLLRPSPVPLRLLLQLPPLQPLRPPLAPRHELRKWIFRQDCSYTRYSRLRV